MVERKQRRKTETDAVLPHFIDLRTEAHLRSCGKASDKPSRAKKRRS